MEMLTHASTTAATITTTTPSKGGADAPSKFAVLTNKAYCHHCNALFHNDRQLLRHRKVVHDGDESALGTAAVKMATPCPFCRLVHYKQRIAREHRLTCTERAQSASELDTVNLDPMEDTDAATPQRSPATINAVSSASENGNNEEEIDQGGATYSDLEHASANNETLSSVQNTPAHIDVGTSTAASPSTLQSVTDITKRGVTRGCLLDDTPSALFR